MSPDAGGHRPCARGDRLDHVVTWWARRTPDAAAVEQHGRRVGYAELVDRAEAVAETLLRQGIQPGDVVATALDRSVDLVVALLGVLRANATAVVLDPAWPPWRTEDVLDLLAVRAVVSGTGISPRATSSEDTGEDAACVVFLSGARPRGVVLSHRGLVAALADADPTAPRVPQSAPLGSEGFTHELWTALLNGGCAVLAPPGTPSAHGGTRSEDDLLSIDPEQVDPEQVEDDRVEAGEETPDSLLAEVRGLLGGAALEPDDDLLAAGMTSLAAVRIATALSLRSGRKITVGDVYRHRRLSAFADASGPVAAPRPVDDDAGASPLAHAQKRFLFAEAYAPGSADNLLVEAYELNGPLRPEVLRAALGDVVERHQALRTVYTWERGHLLQHLVSAESLSWTEVPPPDDHARLTAREIAERVTADLWDTPFRLDRELSLRVRLCRLTPDRALLCLQFHHIAFDGSSERPFLADLRHAYAERSRGAAPRFPPAPGYPLLGRAEERSLASWSAGDLPYWRETLAHCPPHCLPLPGKGSENEAPAREAVRHLDAAAVRRLTLAAAHCAGPPLAALSAGAAMAVARRFDVDDVCVGTLTAGRFDPDTDEVVGYLVNPFAVPLHGLRRSAGTVLAEAARQVVDGLEHARTPFDELVRDLRPERGRHPWFESLVVLQHPPTTVSLGPVALRSLRVRPPRTSRSWMVEAFPETDGGWDLVTTWREDVLDGDTGEALADDLVAALEDIAADIAAAGGAEHGAR